MKFVLVSLIFLHNFVKAQVDYDKLSANEII